jgi:hypothetical protein
MDVVFTGMASVLLSTVGWMLLAFLLTPATAE